MRFLRHIFNSTASAKIAALILAFAAPAFVQAQSAPAKELSDKVTESIQTLSKMFEDKNFDGALNTINNLIAQSKQESFDMAYLSQMKAQALVNKQMYAESIVPLETALSLSEKYNFFEKRQELEILWMIAQLYVQDASLEKNQELQKTKFVKALATVRRWISLTPKANFDAYFYAATILYQQATGGGSIKDPDMALLKQAETECQNALLLSIKPKDQAYQLLVAIAQSMNNQVKAAQYLELMLQSNPKSAQYWPMLLASYINIADGMPEGSYIRNEAYAKAVVTVQRAQALGFMITPEDNYRLVAIYVNSNQFEGAIDLLEVGLRNGKIEGSYKNWELLAQSYLQINDNRKAIATFQEAAKHFPNDGAIDMQVGNLYFNMEQYRPALDSMLIAAKKGVPSNKAPQLYFFIAYLHLELKELQQALTAVDKSLELNPGAQDAQDLKRVINDSIEEVNRNLNKAQPTAAPQQTEAQKA